MVDLRFTIDLSQSCENIKYIMKSVCRIATLYDGYEEKRGIGRVWVEFIHNAQNLSDSRGICYTPHANRKKYRGSWRVGGWNSASLQRHPSDYAMILKNGLEKRK